MKTHPTTRFYSERTKQHLANKAKMTKVKNLLLTVGISLIACVPLVVSFYIITNN